MSVDQIVFGKENVYYSWVIDSEATCLGNEPADITCFALKGKFCVIGHEGEETVLKSGNGNDKPILYKKTKQPLTLTLAPIGIHTTSYEIEYFREDVREISFLNEDEFIVNNSKVFKINLLYNRVYNASLVREEKVIPKTESFEAVQSVTSSNSAIFSFSNQKKKKTILQETDGKCFIVDNIYTPPT